MMEVYRILDEFEADLDASSRIPLTNKLVIPEDTVFKYIDRMRAILPEDIRQAQWIKKERQRILDDAEAEAQKILEKAKDKVKELANETEILKLAEHNGQEILKQARSQAQEITHGAFSYADEVMGQIQSHLEKHSMVLKEGRHQIKQALNNKPQIEKDSRESAS